ncbi:MAG: amidohydrolase family protein [Candidatus Binataceae bacterium]
MPYAQGRTFYDADSHLMELSEWLPKYADPAVRERIRPLYLGGAGAKATELIEQAKARAADPAATRALEANVMGSKGWLALGAFDPAERTRALDLLGVQKQLVFPTFAFSQFLGDDQELLWGGTRALNRAIGDFCSSDKRLIAVGSVPWGEHTVAEAKAALDAGCGAILVNSMPGRDKSPTHPDYHPLWAMLQERRVPFMLHIGGGGRALRRSFTNNGLPPTTDWLGGGENVRAKDYMVIHQTPEQFLSCMVLDGIFEKFPKLQGGVIEQGAMFVPSLMRRLDICQQTFSKTEPALKTPLKASEYLRRQVKFTPFPTEPVGWIIENSAPEMLLFSTDYPHPEGTKDPIGRFEATMASVSEIAKERFYYRNFAEMMGDAA